MNNNPDNTETVDNDDCDKHRNKSK